MQRSAGFLLLVLILSLVAFTTGGLLHELVPHEHRGFAWEFIHTAIGYEGKRLFAPMPVLAGALAFLALERLSSPAPRGREENTTLDSALHRGILSYRKFG